MISKYQNGGIMLTKEKIIERALEAGFHQAAIIETSQIVFDPSFRPYCQENLCGQYGANYSCPPECGSPEEMRQRILKHKYALVLVLFVKLQKGTLVDSLICAIPVCPLTASM